jgi:hypothetical protein
MHFQNPKELKYKPLAHANQYPCISSVFISLIPLIQNAVLTPTQKSRKKNRFPNVNTKQMTVK